MTDNSKGGRQVLDETGKGKLWPLTTKIPGIPSDKYIILDPQPFNYRDCDKAQETIKRYYSNMKGVMVFHNNNNGGYYIVQEKPKQEEGAETLKTEGATNQSNLEIPGIPSDEYIVLDPRPFVDCYLDRAYEIIEQFYSKRRGVMVFQNPKNNLYYIVQLK